MQELMNKVAATISDAKSGPGTRVLVSMIVQTLTIDTKTGDVKTDPGPESLIVASSGSEGKLKEPVTMPHDLRLWAMMEGLLGWHVDREVQRESRRIAEQAKKEFVKEVGSDPNSKDIAEGAMYIVAKLVDALYIITETYQASLDGGDKTEIRSEA